MGFNILTDERQGAPVTFAEPDEGSSYGQFLQAVTHPGRTLAGVVVESIRNPKAFGEMVGVAERQNNLTETWVSGNVSTEEAYDRRIKVIKAATGVELQNPMRQSLTAQMVEQAREGNLAEPGVMTPELFDQQLAELRAKHPDKTEALSFGDIGAEARALAKGAEDEYEKARKETPLSGPTSLAAQFIGGMWGQRRDPLFVGSLFAGPTSAVGKTAVARVASSALFQGLYNAGISALEQPAVQMWRSEIGAKSGVVPAIENVGMAFLFGLIPGAAIRGIHEAGRPAIRRTLAGVPERGDIDAALKAVDSELAPHEAAAVRMGEDMADADRVTAPPKPKDVAPDLHDDLSTAAQRHGDDPLNQPSPEAVEAVSRPEADPEIAARVAEAEPKTLHEAQMAASEAIEEQGNRASMAATRATMERDSLPAPAPLPEGVKPPPASSKDPLDKIPMAKDDGTPGLVSARTAAKAGERETFFATLVRECK